jgi:hypothetical protein
MKSIFYSLTIVLLFGASCKKYEEGPAFSLKSKTERVANSWKVAQAFEDGKDVTADYNKYELDLTKTGSARLSAKYKFAGLNYQFETDGTWSFVSDKEKIAFNFNADEADAVYTILKLKEDEMWLREDGEDFEIHLVPR